MAPYTTENSSFETKFKTIYASAPTSLLIIFRTSQTQHFVGFTLQLFFKAIFFELPPGEKEVCPMMASRAANSFSIDFAEVRVNVP